MAVFFFMSEGGKPVMEVDDFDVLRDAHGLISGKARATRQRAIRSRQLQQDGRPVSRAPPTLREVMRASGMSRFSRCSTTTPA